MQVMHHLNHIPIKLEWRITKLPNSKSDIKKRFIVAGYQRIHFITCREGRWKL